MRTPSAPSGSQWTTVTAFPNLGVTNTIVISSNPGDNRIYVGSQDGLVVAFENRPDVSTSTTFLDLRDRVAVPFEGGLLGLAFHPDFGQTGSPHRKSFYVYYSSHCPIDASGDAADLGSCDDSYPRDPAGGFFNVYLRLSRFEVFEGTATGDPSSEQVLLNFRLYNPQHRGGGLGVNREGLLYLSIGDQGERGTAQQIEDNFNGGALRLAVNVTDNGDGTWSCPPNSHQPRRVFDTFDETSGRHYCIPNDNPWLDATGGFFEEYCAIGLRNPFRLGIDPVSERVWVGDVGQDTREEVDVIECGNNYGWPFREGTVQGPLDPPSTYIGVLTDPVVDFTRDEAASIIGGYVYRGSRFPELYGRYLVGDYITDRIWAVTLDESTMTGTKTYLTSFVAGNLVTWGQDNAGEVFLGDIYGTGLIYRLERAGDPAPDAPSLLSQTGAFSDLATATPSSYWVPYGLNQPFWSDGASKDRFIALPNDGVRDTAGERVGFSATGNWTFPTGTVLMKHFELPVDETNPTVKTRLETRFMVLGDDGQWYGLTYRWRANQLEADLLTSEETATYRIARSGGGTRDQTWYFPSRLDCSRCHRGGSGGALGLRTHQLNRDFTYPSTGRTDNQLRTWNDLGMFSPAVTDASIPGLPRAPGYVDVTAPLQQRARSWLDSNCSYCHRPGEIDAGFDARFTTPFGSQGFLWTPVRDDLGNPGTVVIYPGDPFLSALWQRSAAVGPIAMPPLAKALAEQPAVDLLAEWIERLPSSSPNTSPILTNPGEQRSRPGDAVALSLAATDADGDALYFDASGLPAGLSLNHGTGAISGIFGGAGTQIVTASASDGPSVSVVTFTWRVAVAACGDGTLDGGEQCDDGNLVSGDGCTSGCALEVCGDGVVNNGGAETCEPPGTALCNDTCRGRAPVCGDGYRTPPEQCEDGNTVNGDGCTSSCVLEFCGDGVVNDGAAERCEPPGTATCADDCTTRAALCGDGFVTAPEQCDDRNAVGGDGCTSGCMLEVCGDGVINNGGAETCEPPGTATCTGSCTIRQPLCGDGFLTAPEQCDDGNRLGGDGCTSGCVLERCGDGIVNDDGAETCEPPDTALCNELCQARTPICGDGFRTPPEACDDGNVVGGDGCTAACELEVCGDGVVNDDGAEACEPPGTASCDDGCQTRTPICGDGFLTAPEQCDDRNVIDGDGCSSDCVIEVPPSCGNGTVDSGEGCDDGNSTNGDGCTSGCVRERCGDGIVNNDGAEACDPPNTALCTSSCQARAPQCGDGFRTPPEQCDDSNTITGDGCTASCALERCGDGVVNDDGREDCEPPGTATCTENCTNRSPSCGDGLVTPPEQCDDANAVDGDGCASGCVLEVCGDGIVNNGSAEDCEPPGTSACSINCTTRTQLCGDGFVTAPEECDDGNLIAGDGCTPSCVLEVCGDGIVNDGGAEACEPPATALCDDTCQARTPLCGDGHRTPPEQCEDGNLVDGDGCTSGCVLELCGDGIVNNDGAEDCEPPGTATCNDDCTAATPFCGDGEMDQGEECDDGNLNDGDGCSSMCELESVVEPDAGVPMPDAGVTPDGGSPMQPDAGRGDPPPGTISGDVSAGCNVRRGESPTDAFALFCLLGLVLARRWRFGITSRPGSPPRRPAQAGS